MIPLLEQLRGLLDAQDLLSMLAGDSTDEAAAAGFARAAHLAGEAHAWVIDDMIYRIAKKESPLGQKGLLPPVEQDVTKLTQEIDRLLDGLAYTPYRQMIAEVREALATGREAASAYSRNRIRVLAELIGAGRLAAVYLLSARQRQLENFM